MVRRIWLKSAIGDFQKKYWRYIFVLYDMDLKVKGEHNELNFKLKFF